MLTILYEDNHLIAVQKPHGMLTQGDETGDENLFDAVKVFIKERDQKPGNVFLGLLHRLDRPVGGVVLFAKTSKGASRLSEQFRSHVIEKVYWCVVEGSRGSEGSKGSEGSTEKYEGKDPGAGRGLANGLVVQWLVKDERKNFVTAYDREVPGSQRAELAYRVLKSDEDFALVEVRPKTGRPHQIRVAMASKVGPIVGDVKYGASEGMEGNIALFARELSFSHPILGERITVTAEPQLEIFSIFEN
jgi:23S rRNA pseudouridine1911/1915/1917 synthase